MIFKDMVFKYCKYNDRGQAQEKRKSVARFTTMTEGWEMPYFRDSMQYAVYHLQHCPKALKGKSLL